MFSRLSQLARHISSTPPPALWRPISVTGLARSSSIMASASADQRATRTIHTAACLIIGDEVLGGKVRLVYQACGRLSLTH
jgi:hypothetical protein